VDRPEIAVLVGPFVPDADAVLLQVGDVGVALQEPQQFVDDGLEMQLLGGNHREAPAQVETHLPAENGARAGAGAVGFVMAVFEHVTHQVEVLLHESLPFDQKCDSTLPISGRNGRRPCPNRGAAAKLLAGPALRETVVLKKMGSLFTQKEEHPLAEPRQLKKIIAELPKDNAFKSLDEIVGWLESLLAADDIPADRFHEAARQLDEAAQPHVRRLTKDYLQSARLTGADEKRLWSITYGFWTLLAEAYERSLARLGDKGRPAEQLKAALPVICARLLAAIGGLIKWDQFHYGPSSNLLWQRLGAALLTAEEAGVADKVIQFGGLVGVSSPAQEYQKVMVFQAASMDSLLPLEIELAERLIEHFLPSFV